MQVAPPTELEKINYELRKDALDNFDALSKDRKKTIFTDWMEISPLFMSMGIEFETHWEFLDLYNETARIRVEEISEVVLTRELFVSMILEKVSQTDPVEGIIAELESTYDTFDDEGTMVCLFEDMVSFMADNNWLNASKDAILQVMNKHITETEPQFYKL